MGKESKRMQKKSMYLHVLRQSLKQTEASVSNGHEMLADAHAKSVEAFVKHYGNSKKSVLK